MWLETTPISPLLPRANLYYTVGGGGQVFRLWQPTLCRTSTIRSRQRIRVCSFGCVTSRLLYCLSVRFVKLFKLTHLTRKIQTSRFRFVYH